MQAHLPADQLAAVKRVLYGANQGQAVGQLDLPKQAQQAAADHAFDLQAYRFTAAPEQLRAPRVVRVGLIQHGIVKPTTAPFDEQRQVRARAVSSWLFTQCWGVNKVVGCRNQLGKAPSTINPLPLCLVLQAIYQRVTQLIEAAGAAGVNVLCLQEAW